MGARVIVLAGPSGSGKSRLAGRLGMPALSLDDFYRDGDDPALPRLGTGAVDWDDPRSWRHEDAVAAVEALCTTGSVDVPVYDIPQNGRIGSHRLDLGKAVLFVAEGIFAQEIVRDCRERGLLADAICLRHHRIVTFWRRLTRDLKEQRKPPLVLLRRGLRLYRAEGRVVEHAVRLGCVPLRPAQAHARICGLLTAAGSPLRSRRGRRTRA